jgi:hypothetical protein
MDEGYVVKLIYDNATVKPRWVMAGRGRGLGTREHATVFPDRKAATAEARIWEVLSNTAFTVVIEPA